jgi:hypothetical protein
MEGIVAKPKRKIPRIQFGAPSQFFLDLGQWVEIEQAFGCCLKEQARQEILAVTKQFLQFAEAESNTGLIDDAVEHVKRLRKHGHSLLCALDDTSMPPATLGYVRDQLLAADLNVLSAELRWVVRGCDTALREMAELSDHRFWPDRFAWQNWIKQLTAIAEHHELPTGARKDTDKNPHGKVSQFVAFVGKLQTYVPVPHRRGKHSISALSEAIDTARSGQKVPVCRVDKPDSDANASGHEGCVALDVLVVSSGDPVVSS